MKRPRPFSEEQNTRDRLDQVIAICELLDERLTAIEREVHHE